MRNEFTESYKELFFKLQQLADEEDNLYLARAVYEAEEVVDQIPDKLYVLFEVLIDPLVS